MAEKELSYGEAMAQIEEIVRALNDNTLDVDILAEKVEKATQLIALCRNKLLKAQSKIEEVIGK
ncbi:hypothetical protein BN938_1317 [Mucinivorans hirudinis]|uniref:Exodeoxyribonuclease VII small subunit n=1 Tax=Mucinivorans hirudinis TaxID=1433126 RepID=A0A060R7T0_9BACT|nr:hypothetical protein BN938_1317 [Mucinivorans hirudinis]